MRYLASIYISGENIFEDPMFWPIFIGVIVVVFVIAAVVRSASQNADNNKPIYTKRGRILDASGTINAVEAWYNVECDDGQRLRLRNLNPKYLILAVGDYGTFRYQGQTILSFEKEIATPRQAAPKTTQTFIPCPCCGAQVSNRQYICPNCGRRMQ